MLGLVLLLSRQSERAPDEGLGEAEGFELLASSAIAVEDAHAQPGNILVAVRHPHALEHVAAALQGGADREVVVMTVRLHGVDTDSAGPDDPTPLPAERYLFSRVITLVERYGRPVRLLVVPAATVADGLATAVGRLRSSAVYVGESATLSVGRPGTAARRGVGAHLESRSRSTSGSSSITAAGAPTPITSARTRRRSRPETSTLFTGVWREATRAVGPHVHHHDVVRAALTHMEATTERSRSGRRARAHPRHGPPRRGAGRRHSGRATSPVSATWCATVRPARSPRCSPPLGLEDQVVAFRVLPRKDAAAVFEYLSHECAGSAAQGDGPGGRRRAPQRHGPGRSHDVPGGTAGGGDARSSWRC